MPNINRKKQNRLILKGYQITPCAEGEGYKLTELPEDLCREMCDMEDQGKRYSPDCRYLFTTAVAKGHTEGDYTFDFGTAKAAVQISIMNVLGDACRWVKIEPIKID